MLGNGGWLEEQHCGYWHANEQVQPGCSPSRETQRMQNTFSRLPGPIKHSSRIKLLFDNYLDYGYFEFKRLDLAPLSVSEIFKLHVCFVLRGAKTQEEVEEMVKYDDRCLYGNTVVFPTSENLHVSL